MSGDTGRTWRLAGWALVKTTGFPYESLERLRSPDAAEGDDDDVAKAVADCVDRLTEECARPRFLEAVLMSSPDAFARLRGWTEARPRADGLRSKDRRRVLLAAMYLQRLCAKNESTSFFGPVHWARVGTGGPVLLDVGDPAPPRLATRWTHWAAQAVADEMARDPDVLPGLTPVRRPELVIRDGSYLRVNYPDWPLTVTAVEAPPGTHDERRLVELSDGSRTAAEIAVVEGLPVATVVEGLLDLDRRGLVRFGVHVPMGLTDPMGHLRDLAARLPGDRWTRELAELDVHRERFGAATALDRRHTAMAATAEAFTHLTGKAAEKDAGRHYADRSVLVEDGCHRWPAFDIGEPLHAHLRQEMPVVLDLLFELSLARRRRRVELVTTWFAATFGDGPVPLDRVLSAADADALGKVLRAEDDRLTAHGPSAITDWLLADPGRARVTVPLDEARARADAVPFDTWCVAGADLFVDAPDVAAINDGRFQMVVGEVHGLHDQLLQGLWPDLHPDRAALETELGDLIGGLTDGVVCDPVIGHWRKTLARAAVLPEIEFSGPSPRPPGRAAPAHELTVRRHDRRLLLESPRLGRVYLTRPPLADWGDEIESVFTPFTGARLVGAEEMFRTLDDAAHLPRLTLGRTVVHRETWRVPPPERPHAWRALTASGQRLAHETRERYGLPEQGYVRFPDEPKPIFVDFGVPVLADLFARHHARARRPATVSEMLPGPRNLWLRQGGGRHTAELRFGYYRPAGGGGSHA